MGTLPQDLRIPIDSLVVLPASQGDPAAGVWSEACAEAIAERLSSCGQLRVIPSRRVRAFAGADSSPEEIGRRLNVRCAVVCSAVLHDRAVDLRVDAIDVFSETVLASETLLSSTETVFTLQDQAACLLANHLGIDVHSLRRARTRRNASSYARCLQARVLIRRGAFREAVTIYGDVIADVPDNTETLIEFARAVAALPCRFVDDSMLAARNAIDRALRVAPECAQARTASALLHCRFDCDWPAADGDLRLAIRCDPAFLDAHYWRGMLLIAMRRFDEAERALDAAATLCGPASVEACGPALLRLYERRFADAARKFREVSAPSHWLVRALVLDGRIAEASDLVVDSGDFTSAGIVAAFLGETEEAIAAAGKMDDPYDAALILATIGDVERAMSQLDRARSFRSASMMFAGVDPLLLPLRDRLDFRQMLIELRLP